MYYNYFPFILIGNFEYFRKTTMFENAYKHFSTFWFVLTYFLLTYLNFVDFNTIIFYFLFLYIIAANKMCFLTVFHLGLIRDFAKMKIRKIKSKE